MDARRPAFVACVFVTSAPPKPRSRLNPKLDEGMFELDFPPGDVGALIFDCDGTLVDTPPIYARAWAQGLALSGIAMEADWYMARAGMSAYLLMDAFEAEHGVMLARDEVLTVMRRVFAESIDQLREIQAIADIARRYHRRLPMAVASGGSAEIVAATLRATNLLPFFDTVVALDDVKQAKPAPDLFLEAARRLGVAPGQCLVFEDSREGLEAARRAGMPAVDVVEVLGVQSAQSEPGHPRLAP